MPKFVVTFNAPDTVFAKTIIEADNLAEAERIAHELRDADKPIEFSHPEIQDRRDIRVSNVRSESWRSSGRAIHWQCGSLLTI
jgi:hypothetical protein